MPDPDFLLKLSHCKLLRVWRIKCYSADVLGSSINTALQHQSKERALNLMTDATSLLQLLAHTLLHTHTLMRYMSVCVCVCVLYVLLSTYKVPPSHPLICPPSLFHTLFSISSSSVLSHPLPSLWWLRWWWFTLWITHGYLKVSAHISFFLPLFLASLSLLLRSLCAAHFLSCFSFSFQSFTLWQAGFVSTPHQRERGAKI